MRCWHANCIERHLGQVTFTIAAYAGVEVRIEDRCVRRLAVDGRTCQCIVRRIVELFDRLPTILAGRGNNRCCTHIGKIEVLPILQGLGDDARSRQRRVIGHGNRRAAERVGDTAQQMVRVGIGCRMPHDVGDRLQITIGRIGIVNCSCAIRKARHAASRIAEGQLARAIGGIDDSVYLAWDGTIVDKIDLTTLRIAYAQQHAGGCIKNILTLIRQSLCKHPVGLDKRPVTPVAD